MVQPCTAPLRRVLSTSSTTALCKLGSSCNAPLCARILRLIAICDIIFHRRLISVKKKAINGINRIAPFLARFPTLTKAVQGHNV